MAYGVEPPEPLIVVQPSVEKLYAAATANMNQTYPSEVLRYVIGMSILQFFAGLALGIPKVFYSLAKFFGMPWLVPPVTALGALMQVCAYWYLYKTFINKEVTV